MKPRLNTAKAHNRSSCIHAQLTYKSGHDLSYDFIDSIDVSLLSPPSRTEVS